MVIFRKLIIFLFFFDEKITLKNTPTKTQRKDNNKGTNNIDNNIDTDAVEDAVEDEVEGTTQDTDITFFSLSLTNYKIHNAST